VTKKDWDMLAKYEQAIAKKYGKEAVQNPKGNWTNEKEEEYLDQIKRLAEKEMQLLEKDEKVDINGILIPKKLLNRESNRTCLTCGAYSFDIRDDVYMNKFDCCRECYIKWVEDREERWLSGWRPNNGNDT